MSSSSLGPLKQLWFKWKSLKLPWRRRWLAGRDLRGNTYWYFQPTSSARPRRLAQSDPLVPYSDIQITPQWHQWLRYTRPLPPSIPEQQADLVRQRDLKYLARAADERWAAKPSVLDKPPGSTAGALSENKEINPIGQVSRLEGGQRLVEERKKGKANPWKVRTGKAGEEWQPEAWSPGERKI